MPLSKVIIVGAGPSGLLLALLLSKAGIPVDLLEQADGLDNNPRASHYTAESCIEFERAGILDEVCAEGFIPDGVSWRRLDQDKTRMVAVRNTPGPGGHSMVCLPLHRLGRILERKVLEQDNARILYGYKVVEIGRPGEEGKAWVKVERKGTEDEGGGVTEVREADYVVGCDGANSTIRRRLFGDDVYPGYTWDEQIVATNVYYDYLGSCGYDDSQFFVDPEHW
jgi:2-polyprenyl-6-methoxyphenol hydroxylase-like FAD-dependent oxidoreductase